jgi:hypothetical protein
MAAKRIDAEKVRAAIAQNAALLVCAYDDAARAQKFRLPGTLSLEQFEARAAKLPKDYQVVFYCA